MLDLRTLFPPFWRDDPLLLQLLAAVNAAVQNYLTDVVKLLQSGAASTAQEPYLSRWEELFGIPKNAAKSRRDRQASVMAKMRNEGVCTKQKLKEVACAFYRGEVDIYERMPNNDSFKVEFVGQQGVPNYIGDASAAIAAVAPAHLSFAFAFRYLLIHEVSAMTLEELETKNLDYFAGG